MSAGRRARGAAVAARIALSAAVAGACGGGQTQGVAFDPRWANDDGAAISAFQQQVASSPVPIGADVAVGILGGAREQTLVGAPLDGGPRWTYSHALDARPAIAGSVVVGIGGGELFALDARTGKLLWKRNAGGRLRGAGDDGRTTVVSLVSRTGSGSVVLAVTHRGEVVRQIEDDAAIGVPAVMGRYALLPWKGQYVTAFDLQTGGEVARALLRTEVSRVFASGGALFFGGVAATRMDDRIGLASRGGASKVELPARGLPGSPRWMSPGADVLEPAASAPDKIRLYARPAASGAAAVEGGRFAATYFRIAAGLDARTGALAWARTSDADILGGAAYAGGFAFCDAGGQVTLVEATRGAKVGEVSLGGPVDGCVVQADGLRPGAAKAAEPPLLQQLERIIKMPDAELMAMQRVLLQELATLADEGATRALIEVASAPRTAPPLLEDARKALAERRTGASFMLAALGARYDHLAGVLQPPPVGPLADALAAMNERRAAPLLAQHLNDPATSSGDVRRAAAALSVLAGEAELQALRTFLALYRSVTDDDALVAAVVSVAEALVRLGGGDLVARAAADVYTSPALREPLARLAGRKGGPPAAGKASPGR